MAQKKQTLRGVLEKSVKAAPKAASPPASGPYNPAAEKQQRAEFLESLDRRQRQTSAILGRDYEVPAPLTAQQRADKVADIKKRFDAGQLSLSEKRQAMRLVNKRRSTAISRTHRPVDPVGDAYDAKKKGK